MPASAKARKVVVKLIEAPPVQGYFSTLSWKMAVIYGLAGLLMTAVAVITGLKLRSAKDEDEKEEEEYSEVVRTRRATLAEYERRSSVIYTPEEEALFLEADRKRAKGKALDYMIEINEAEITRVYDRAVIDASNGLVRAIVEGTSTEAWSTEGSQNLCVLQGDRGDQVRCCKKCDVPSETVAKYLFENICLGGHEGSIYRCHDIATVQVPITAPVITASEVPEPNVVAMGVGVIRRFKCQEKSMFSSSAKRDYLILSIKYKLPTSEDGDGSYFVFHTSIEENDVTSLSDISSPSGTPLSSPQKLESSPDPRRSIGDLVFNEEGSELDTPSSANKHAAADAGSPVRLHHKDETHKKRLLGTGNTKRHLIPFSGFVIEANSSNICCKVHYASLADKADTVKSDVKLSSLNNYFNKMSDILRNVSDLNGNEAVTAIDELAKHVRVVSGEVASRAKPKTPEEIMDEAREKDEARYKALLDKGPVLPEHTNEGVFAGYTAILRLHDYLDLPRDYLAEKSFVHNCPPGVKRPRRHRLSVMQMVGLEEVPDNPQMMKLSHTPRALPQLDFVVKAQSQGVVCASAKVPDSSFNAVRATAVLKVKKKEMVKLLLDDSRASDFDDMLDSFTVLTRVSPYNVIKHMRFKAIFPTAGRDFVVCSTWEGDLYDLEPIMVAATSYKDELADPKGSSFVRGSIPISGYLIEPFESISPEDVDKTLAECKLKPGDFGPGHIKVTFLNHLELNGNLPTSVINNLSVSAPVKLLRLIESVILKDRSRK